MTNWISPVTLQGKYVRLEPLSEAHAPALTAIGMDQEIWRHMPYGEMHNEDDIRRWIQILLARQAQGTDVPFAVMHLASGRAAGATRYMDIRAEHRALEIGGTWYGTEFRRTAVNTESKYLLLKHAFEVLGCVRVQLKADLRNIRSQKAIERLGATREGVLRKQMIMPDGYHRDSVFYSIIDTEWTEVKKRLEEMLER